MNKEMVFTRYESYKDSGFDWLGDIPSDWKLQRLATVFEERKEKVSDKDFPPLSVTKNGVVPQLDSAAKSDDGDNRKGVREGDFVINSRSDRKGSSGIAKQDGSVSLINIVLRPKGIAPRYSEHLLKSNGFIEEFYRNGHGIVADLWTTRYWDMKSIHIPLPDMATQERIANFLDQKTVEINESIAKKQRLIELLKEQKTILINQAVTKGLNPDVPMRDSGVEWIGTIPAHWAIKKNRELFTERKESGSESLPILSVSLHTGVSDSEQDETENIRSKVRIEDKTFYRRVYPGDIAFNMMRAWQGAIGVVKTDGQVSPAYIIASPCNLIDGEYFEYQYRTSMFIGQMDRCSKGITDFRKRLYWAEFKQLSTIVPPVYEQKEIIEKIRDIAVSIDKVVELTAKEIDQIKELRTILISDAVTGKIKL